MTLQPYQYAYNNPVMFNDPTGMRGEMKGKWPPPGWKIGDSGPGEKGPDGSDGKTIRTQDIEEVIVYARKKINGFFSRVWNGIKEGWTEQGRSKTNADKYGNINSHRIWQSTPGYNEGEDKYDRIFRLIGNSHNEIMLDFGGGGYNMYGGYGRTGKVLSTVEKTENLISASPSKIPQVGELFESLGAKIIDGKISILDRAVSSGRFEFVVTSSGELKIGTGHFYLSGGANEVQAAGQLRLFRGKVMEINNSSGHYLPSTVQAQKFPSILSKMGIDVTKAKLKTYTPE